jgi:hypothetical protein
MYELARNWRIGWDLAGVRAFRLVNLGPEQLFKESKQLDSFENALAISEARSFQRLTWTLLLHSVVSDLGGLPDWLTQWLAERGLKHG